MKKAPPFAWMADPTQPVEGFQAPLVKGPVGAVRADAAAMSEETAITDFIFVVCVERMWCAKSWLLLKC